MTEEQIAELLELAKKRTPGVWVRLSDSGEIVSGLIEQNGGICRYKASICQMKGEDMVSFDDIAGAYYNGDPVCDDDGEPVDLGSLSAGDHAEYNWPWDGDYIVAAANLAPDLCEELSRLRAELERLSREIRHVVEATGVRLTNPSKNIADELCNVMQAYIAEHDNLKFELERLKAPVRVTCAPCNGTGWKERTEAYSVECPVCHGFGSIPDLAIAEIRKRSTSTETDDVLWCRDQVTALLGRLTAAENLAKGAEESEKKCEQDYQNYMNTIRLNIPEEFAKQPQLDLCMQRMKEAIAGGRAELERVKGEREELKNANTNGFDLSVRLLAERDAEIAALKLERDEEKARLSLIPVDMGWTGDLSERIAELLFRERKTIIRNGACTLPLAVRVLSEVQKAINAARASDPQGEKTGE